MQPKFNVVPTGNPLGNCHAVFGIPRPGAVPTECGGDLCVRGSMVSCILCGTEVPDHPVTRDMEGLAIKLKRDKERNALQQPVTVRPQDMESQQPQLAKEQDSRIAGLELVIAAQGDRLAELERQISGRKAKVSA